MILTTQKVQTKLAWRTCQNKMEKSGLATQKFRNFEVEVFVNSNQLPYFLFLILKVWKEVCFEIDVNIWGIF